MVALPRCVMKIQNQLGLWRKIYLNKAWPAWEGSFAILLVWGLQGCGVTAGVTSPLQALQPQQPQVGISLAQENANQEHMPGGRPDQSRSLQDSLISGTGVFLNSQFRDAGNSVRHGKKGGVTLNFEKADISKVVDMMLGNLLKVNYFVDPAVRGSVTLQTSRPIRDADVLPILENILKTNNAKLLHSNGLYQIVPEKSHTVASAGLGRRAVGAGTGLHILPLRYIGAEQMAAVLQPLADKGAAVIVDKDRNLLMLEASAQDLSVMLELADMFDVDWLQGMSIALLQVRHASAETLVKELDGIFLSQSKQSPLNGVLRFVPIERLNAILAISTQGQYLGRVQEWLQRLDVPGSGEGEQLFVYPVENGNAADLAGTLNELFADVGAVPASGKNESTADLAPGLKPVTLSSLGETAAAKPPAVPASQQSSAPMQGAEKSVGVVAAVGGHIRIMAAKDNNVLLILASPSDYSRIETAIKKLDVAPLQVLVEASIIDVRLSGELNYGMQWFFNNRLGSNYSGDGSVGGALSFSPTFSYNVVNRSDQLRSLLGLLASDGKVDVLSSPSLMVRNNQTANIRVGDQQPVSTALVSAEGKVVASSVQFKDTGVLLEVTPRVNSGGMVSLDVIQEVTDVGDIDEATGQRAFLRRSIQSTVAVNSGETVVLGGLIRENKVQGKTGVPVLRDIPFLGWLFGKTITSTSRTELLIMLTPKVIRNSSEARRVTAEYRQKLRYIESSLPPPSTINTGVAPAALQRDSKNTAIQATDIQSADRQSEKTLGQ